MTASLAPIIRRPVAGTRRRDGLLAVAALTCLLVVTSIVFSMLQGALRSRQELLVERDRRQAEMLVVAGAAHTVERLAVNADFPGEIWELSANDIVDNGSGRVTTKVSRDENGQVRQVHVVAEYPLDRDFPIRRSDTFGIATSKTR